MYYGKGGTCMRLHYSGCGHIGIKRKRDNLASVSVIFNILYDIKAGKYDFLGFIRIYNKYSEEKKQGKKQICSTII